MCMNTYKGNATFPEGPAPSSLEPPGIIIIQSLKYNYYVESGTNNNMNDKEKYLEVLTHQKDFEEFCKQTRKRNYVSARHSRANDMLEPNSITETRKCFNLCSI